MSYEESGISRFVTEQCSTRLRSRFYFVFLCVFVYAGAWGERLVLLTHWGVPEYVHQCRATETSSTFDSTIQ